MENNPYLKWLPLIIKWAAFIDVQKGSIKTPLMFMMGVLCSTFTSFILWSLSEPNHERDLFVKVHDLIITLIVVAQYTNVTLKKTEICAMVKHMLEALPSYPPESMQYKLVLRYNRTINHCGKLSTGFFLYSFNWVLLPIYCSVYDVQGSESGVFDLPVSWITNVIRDPHLILLARVLAVCVLLSGVVINFCWYSTIVFSVLRLQLNADLMMAEIRSWDERAETMCCDRLAFLQDNTLIPSCGRCRFAGSSSFSGGTGDVCIVGLYSRHGPWRSRPCCKAFTRSLLLEYCTQRCLVDVIHQHQRIIEYAKVIDKTFKVTALTFTYLAAIIPATSIVNINNVCCLSVQITQITVLEVLYSTVEMVGVLVFTFAIYYCGQIVLDMSANTRLALYESNWPNKTMANKKRVLMMMTVANKPLRLTAGRLHTLSLETYFKYVEAMYSYVRLCQTLKESDF